MSRQEQEVDDTIMVLNTIKLEKGICSTERTALDNAIVYLEQIKELYNWICKESKHD